MLQANAEQKGLLDDAFSVAEVEGEAIWVQETLTVVLDQSAKPVRVTRGRSTGGIETSRGLARRTTRREERGRGTTSPRRTFKEYRMTIIGLFEGRNERVGKPFKQGRRISQVSRARKQPSAG